MGDITFTENNATQAVARARTHKTWPKGMCLNHVWDCVSSQVKSYGLYDANAGWAATTLKRYDRNPPAGAPVYWAGYSHGHIAISVGGGRVRSTDCPTDGTVSELAIADIPKRWPGLTYRGYGLDFAGDWISGIAPMEDDMFSETDRADLKAAKALAAEALNKADGSTLRADHTWQNKTNAAAFAALTTAVQNLTKLVADLKTKVDALPKAPGA